MSRTKILPLAETAIATALATVLGFLTINIADAFYIELAVIPIILLALRRGWQWGALGGLLYGLLVIVTGHATILVLSQGLLEYILAPLTLGLAGFFKGKTLALPVFLSVGTKYFFHFIAGGIFWGSFAPKTWNPWLFSFVTQGLSGIVTAIVAFILILILSKSIPKLLL